MSLRSGALLVLACLLSAGQTACATERPDRVSGVALRLVDDAGHEVLLERPPSRIVSLVPSATEILLALGQGGRLVGRTDYDLASEIRHLPSVGGGLRPSMERIVSLEPDVVIRFRAESDPETPRQLDAAGLAHLAIRPDRIADIRRIIALLGDLVREPERAISLTADMDAKLQEVAGRVADARRPRVAFLGGNPPSVAGPGTFLHELIEIAGGENAFGDIGELYAPISLEEILTRDVEAILAPEGTPIPSALASIPLYRVSLEVLNPGLRVGRSAEVVGGLLHPDRFQ